MHVVPPPDPNDPAQPVINAVVAHVLRWGRAPRVVVSMSGRIGAALVAELRRRELEVVAVTNAREMHAALIAHFEQPEQQIDLLVTAADLPGCTPFHAIAWARRHGFGSPVIVAAHPSDEVARREASEVAMELAPQSLLLAAIDRTLLRTLRRMWSERPSKAA